MTKEKINMDVYRKFKMKDANDERIHLYLLVRDFYKSLDPDELITNILRDVPNKIGDAVMNEFFGRIEELNPASPTYKVKFYKEVVMLENSLLEYFIIKSFVGVVSYTNEIIDNFDKGNYTAKQAKQKLDFCLSEIDDYRGSNIIDSLYNKIKDIGYEISKSL